MAVRSRYKLKLVTGSLYVGRLHVQGLIDHDAKEVRITDEIDAAERLELAAKLMRLARRQAAGRGLLNRVYPHGLGGASRVRARRARARS